MCLPNDRFDMDRFIKKIEEMEFLAKVEERSKGRAVFSLSSNEEMKHMSVNMLMKMCGDRMSCKSVCDIDNLVMIRKNVASRLRSMINQGVSLEEMNVVMEEYETEMKNNLKGDAIATSKWLHVSVEQEEMSAKVEAEREKKRAEERKRMKEEEIEAMARNLEEILLAEEMKEMEAQMANRWEMVW